jgi:putative endonuclease
MNYSLPLLIMQYFVYILFSKKLNKYYIGSTSNIEDRLKKHNSAHKGFTSTGQPWKFVYHEIFNNKTEALLRENQLKGWKNRERIEKLFRNPDAGSEPPDLSVGGVAGSNLTRLGG